MTGVVVVVVCVCVCWGGGGLQIDYQYKNKVSGEHRYMLHWSVAKKERFAILCGNRV